MKILFNCSVPFALAHGGMANQIENTKAGLEAVGVEVEYLRWWDHTQHGDVVHHFGPVPFSNVELVKRHGIPMVVTSLLSATCNRSDRQLRRQGWLTSFLLKIRFGEGIKRQTQWRVYSGCDCNVVGLEAERRVLEMVYGVPRTRIARIPLGLPDIYFNAGSGNRNAEVLVNVGTITAQKNSILLAQFARKAQVPILFVGKPYAASDPYWFQFKAMIDGVWVRHQPHVDSPAAMIQILHQARGAVVMSQYENWCLVADEAAACGLPLLLPDQKWSRERFGGGVSFWTGNNSHDIEVLRNFYEQCPQLPSPQLRFYRWPEVAAQLKLCYERLRQNA